jgi:hypothetical protein
MRHAVQLPHQLSVLGEEYLENVHTFVQQLCQILLPCWN